MGYEAGAAAIMVLHGLFVIFVLFGGLLTIRWSWLILLHLPAAFWGIIVECTGWDCPLTPLENHLHHLGGRAGYEGGFVEHYLGPLLYPAGLDRWTRFFFAVVVLVANGVAYGIVIRRWRGHGRR